MNRSEVAMILTAAAARDRRTIGETDVLAWHEDIGDLDYDVAREAISRHYRESTDWVMPAHIRRHAATIVHDRRRAIREASEARALEAERNDPTRRDRSAEVAAMVAELRDSLPDADPNVLRRPEWVRAERTRRIEAHAEPNPLYRGPAPEGGWPMPDGGDQ